jgi:hypothetical protein
MRPIRLHNSFLRRARRVLIDSAATRIGSAILLVAALLGIAILGIASPALAATGPPAYNPTSYYATDANTSTAYSLGCDQGDADATSGLNSAVILDFFGQNSALTGTDEDFGDVFISNASIEAMAENFAEGYYVCTGSDTSTVDTLGIGTNNDGPANTQAGGQVWGNIVNAVTSWLGTNGVGQVIAYGADDIEDWGTSGNTAPGPTDNWVSGFASKGDLYFNYGGAVGCPGNVDDNAACSDSWDQYNYWYLSWGDPAAFATPEIYYNVPPGTPINAEQWGEISDYGAAYQSDGIVFTAPFSQHERDSDSLTAAQAWDDLETYSGQSDFSYNMVISASYI